MSKNSTLFVGLDLGDKFSYLSIVDHEGDLIEETRLRTTKPALRRKFSTLPSSRVAMEVGTHSRWTSQLIEELNHEVLVANARKLKAIYDNPRKGDRADAETLARLARLDPKLLSPIHHRSPEAQADLALIRSRDALVRSRTLLINHARGTAKAAGIRLPSCSAASFHHKALEAVPETLDPALMPILETVGSLTTQIKEHNRRIEQLCDERYPETKLLTQISGVGPLTALAFLLTLEDPRRFCKSREVGPALGLVPKRDQSGDKDPQLRITKTGNAYLRQLLVNAAHYVLGPFGPDCDLRRWGLKLIERGGKYPKKRAAVAVARKLAVLMHRLWKTGEKYDPFYQSKSHDEQSTPLASAA